MRETEIPNLYIMPAGNIPPNPSELLITPQMISLLEDLKEECDLIIIDGTPSKLVTDAVILSRIVDSTIVVTAHNQTKKDDLEKVVRDIKNVGGNIAGIVYNKVPVSSKKYNETYYYSSIPQKIQMNSKTDFEYEEKREIQKDRTSNMLKKDRNKFTEEELPKAIKNQQAEIKKIKNKEEKTAEVLREYNEYLKRENRRKR